MFYSIAIDESIDNTDFTQVLVFIRAITGDFHCFDELLCLCTMKDRTRGIDIFNAFKEKCNEAKLSFANLVSVCTDGASAMKGVREGFIALLIKELPHPKSLIAFHCILHQQNLAAKSATVGDTFNKVLEIVHFVDWLKHRTHDQHGLGSKPISAILLCLGKTLCGTFPCLVVLASSSKLQ